MHYTNYSVNYRHFGGQRATIIGVVEGGEGGGGGVQRHNAAFNASRYTAIKGKLALLTVNFSLLRLIPFRVEYYSVLVSDTAQYRKIESIAGSFCNRSFTMCIALLRD